MTYATLDQMYERYGRDLLRDLTDRGDFPTGAPVEAIVQRALVNANSFIDGFLGRYDLPLPTTPDPLPDLAQAIAIYRLHRYQPDPKIKDDYDDALRILRDIAAGTNRLTVAGVEPESAASSGNGVRITDRDRPLTAENLKGFI